MKSLLVIISLISSIGHAMDWSAQKWTGQLDLRQTASDAAGTGCSSNTTCTANTQTMFGAGATTVFDMGNDFALRTGGMLTQRGYKQTDSAGAGTASMNLTYLDVPVLPEYKINDMFSAYAGIVVGLKASRSCGFDAATCTSLSDKSIVTPLQVGGTYNIDKQWTAHLTYETGSTLATVPGQASSEVKTSNAIALGGGYTF